MSSETSWKLGVEEIAQIVHEANRAICECAGDSSQKPWTEAEGWQISSAVNGVLFRLNNPNSTAEDQHQAWCNDKRKDGWVYGEVKDATAKTHSCLVPYSQLPFEQRVKDHVFAAIVKACS